LPEQVAQAAQYDWRVLWNKPAASSILSPDYLKDARTIDIPLTVRNILKDISGKPINAIQLSPELTINLEKPLNISKARIDEIYNWLKGKPCGSQALYDYLSYKKGLSPQGTVPDISEEDIAVMALTIDILNDVTKPIGNPKIIKTSLYALSQASEFFGQKLYPVRLGLTNLAKLTPFIAHLNGEHYVLVTEIAQGKVNLINNHNKELLAEIEKLPKEDLWIMTYGEEEFNRAKVEQSGIGKFFNKVQIRVVSGSKKEWVAQTCAEFPEEIIIFVDNRQDFIQEVTREKSKNLRTILYDENGLQKFREAIQQGVT